jgi:hypothetical protein
MTDTSPGEVNAQQMRAVRAIVCALLAVAFHGSIVAHIWAIFAIVWTLPINWDAPALQWFRRG